MAREPSNTGTQAPAPVPAAGIPNEVQATGRKRRAFTRRPSPPKHTYIALHATGVDGQRVPRENIQVIKATTDAAEIVELTMADNTLTVVKIEAKTKAAAGGKETTEVTAAVQQAQAAE